MFISNKSRIKYKVNGSVITQCSNSVYVNIEISLITFMKCRNCDIINVYIKNNSEVDINNVIYKDISINKNEYVEGTLKINNKYFDGNPSIGINLGKVVKNKIINIKYRVHNVPENIGNSLLIYNYEINNDIYTIYLLSKCTTVVYWKEEKYEKY